MSESYFQNIRRCLTCVRGRVCANGACLCPQDGRPIIPHAQAGDCPINLHVAAGSASEPGPLSAKPIDPPIPLPTMWRLLHEWAAAFPIDPAPIAVAMGKRFLRNFDRAISCGGCRYRWGDMTAANPAPLTGRPVLFPWSVEMHNAVSAEAGHPPWTLAQAATEYRVENGVIEAASKPL